MHRRILADEQWRWYWQDVFKPLASALLAAGAIKMIWPNPDTIAMQFIALTLVAVLAFCASTLAAKQLHAQLLAIGTKLLLKIGTTSIQK
jgi:ABC-type phosphate/phosphonate transport system permease subunit